MWYLGSVKSELNRSVARPVAPNPSPTGSLRTSGAIRVLNWMRFWRLVSSVVCEVVLDARSLMRSMIGPPRTIDPAQEDADDGDGAPHLGPAEHEEQGHPPGPGRSSRRVPRSSPSRRCRPLGEELPGDAPLGHEDQEKGGEHLAEGSGGMLGREGPKAARVGIAEIADGGPDQPGLVPRREKKELDQAVPTKGQAAPDRGVASDAAQLIVVLDHLEDEHPGHQRPDGMKDVDRGRDRAVARDADEGGIGHDGEGDGDGDWPPPCAPGVGPAPPRGARRG